MILRDWPIYYVRVELLRLREPGTSEMDSMANLGSRRVYIGVRLLSPLTHIYIYYRGDKQRTYIGVIISGRKRRYL